MRINKFVANASGLSRRAADKLVATGRVMVNGAPAQIGQLISEGEHVVLDGNILKLPEETLTIMLNKPIGYVCSRTGQGSKTIYELLPAEYKKLKPVGRLDKDSSGLLLLTEDGELAHTLTHPKFSKEKVYEIELNKPLKPEDQVSIERGIELEDGLSHLYIGGLGQLWTVKISEGRNRQIRRTFEALGYKITKLHRIEFGPYELADLESGGVQVVSKPKDSKA